MRKQWLTTWTVVVATAGCAVPGIPGAPYRMAQKSQPGHQTVANQGSTPQGASLTQKLKSMIPAAPQLPSKKAQDPQKTDPISLGYASAPPTPELYLSMAEMSDRGGNAEHARSMYQKTLSLQPQNLDALLGLARLEDREGRLDVAVKVYQQAATMHPQNANVLNDLALCHARSGRFAVSHQLLDQAVRLQPKKALYRNNIAKVLLEMNRIDEAVSHLAAVHPPAIVQYNMGVLLHERGRTQEAIRFLTAATHIDPQLQAAGELLTQLQGDSPQIAANDGVLPTPMSRPAHAPAPAPGGPYPSTGMASHRPLPQSFPAETARVPLGNSPTQLPPVR